MTKWTGLACIVLGILSASKASTQEPVENFYRGKSINIYIGSGAGGGYDAYARALARHMGKYIPGNPNIVPQNMPGAGGNKAAGYVYSVAPKDGTALGAIFPGGILAPLIGDTPIQHDPQKFVYVGSANSDVYTCVAHIDSPIKTFKDVFAQEMIVGASNEGGTTRDLPAMSNNVLGTKFRIVTGYSGTREITLAVERKEIHGLCGYGYTSLLSVTPRWLAEKMVRILVQERQGASRAAQDWRAAHARFRQDRRGPPGDGAGLQPGRVRPSLCAAGRRAGRARRGIAQGVHGGVRRSRAAGGSSQDEARRRSTVGRRGAGYGGEVVRHAEAYRRARQGVAGLQAAGAVIGSGT